MNDVGNDVRAIIDTFKEPFAVELADRRFLSLEYATRVLSLSADHENNVYELVCEAGSQTLNFDDTCIPSMCKGEGWSLRIRFDKYCEYAFCRGGNICKWQSLVSEHNRSIGNGDNEGEVEKGDVPVYLAGFSVSGVRLVFMLLFHPDVEKRNKTFETQIMAITIEPSLARAVDRYHKQYIFDAKYLETIIGRVSRDHFRQLYLSLSKLSGDPKFGGGLFKLFYDFLLVNLNVKTLRKLTRPRIAALIGLSQDFERNQKNLFRVRHYRDHFLHQCNVFILGMALIDTFISKMELSVCSMFENSYRPKDEEDAQYCHEDVSLVWLLAAM